jgi:hypothetical protein
MTLTTVICSSVKQQIIELADRKSVGGTRISSLRSNSGKRGLVLIVQFLLFNAPSLVSDDIEHASV